MATQRYISTAFWDDSWVQELDPNEKLFFIYLLTNPLTNIAGVYKISDKRVSFDCGFSKEVVRELWSRFTNTGKAVRYGEWVIIPTWPKHQKWQSRSKIKDGIENVIKDLPREVVYRMIEIGYAYPIDTIYLPYEYPSNYSDSDSDSDSDRDRDRKKKNAHNLNDEQGDDEPFPETLGGFEDTAAQPEASPLKARSPALLKDSLARNYEAAFTAEVPLESWKSIPQQRKHLNDLAKRTRRLALVTSLEENELAAKVMHTYGEMRRTGRSEYWRRAPYTPAGLTQRWDEVVQQLKRDAESEIGDDYEEMGF